MKDLSVSEVKKALKEVIGIENYRAIEQFFDSRSEGYGLDEKVQNYIEHGQVQSLLYMVPWTELNHTVLYWKRLQLKWYEFCVTNKWYVEDSWMSDFK